MHAVSRFVRSIPVLALLAVGLAGCVYDPSAVPSRYVGDLSGLERVKPGPWDELHRRPAVDLAAYRALHVAPVVLASDLDTQGEHYREYDLERVRKKFDLAFEHQFADSGLLSAEAGPGVLTIQPMLTGLRANRPPLDMSNSGLLSTARGVGGATMQMAVVDSNTGELLEAIVDRKWGQEFTSNFNTSRTWGDAEDAFRWWTRTLRARLERAGVGSGAG
jgi:hypothetical protein